MIDDYNTGGETQGRVIHSTGIGGSDSNERDYSIINRVRSIDRTNDKFKRTRSVSRSRLPAAPLPPGETKSTAPLPLARKASSNWSERGTQAAVGGVLGIVRARSQSRARKEESDDTRDEKTKKGFFRGRSSSRQRSDSKGPLGFLRGRSSSKSRKKLEASKRGRSKSTRDDGTQIKNSPPLPPSQGKPRNAALPPRIEPVEPVEPKEKAPEPEVDDAIDKLMAERQLIAEVEAQKAIPTSEQDVAPSGIDSLNDHDIMQLDERNTTMHVACLLHHETSAIIDRLEEDNSLARVNNNADETPLHYAAMDKKGVNKDVLKKLLQLNPEAVKQPNVQNSLPVHLACMVGAPSTYLIKTLLKMYPKAAMIQSDFPLVFEDDMVDNTTDSDDDSSAGSEFVSYTPKTESTAVSGIASMFACAAPNQAAIEMASERTKRRQERTSRPKYEEEGPKVETGFSPLHLAVMNSASPSVVELLIRINARSIHLKTSRGRTALDCAQYIVRQHWLYGTDDENAVQNTFGSIELLEEAITSDP